MDSAKMGCENGNRHNFWDIMDHRVFVFFTRWSYINGENLDKLGYLHLQQKCLFLICVYILNQGEQK